MLPPLRQFGFPARDHAFGVLGLRRRDGSGDGAGKVHALRTVDAGAVVSGIVTIPTDGVLNLGEVEIGHRGYNVVMDSNLKRLACAGV
jgi:hypothetical protein